MSSKEIVGTSKLQLYTPPQQVPDKMLFFDAGGSTYHTHTCPEGNHQWMCNSPYCQVLRANCLDHNGEEPITLGREPWKR